MAKFNNLRTNFLGGEISPRMYGRADLDEYLRMCKEIQNAYVYPQGGVGRRPGSQFFLHEFTNAAGNSANLDVTGPGTPYVGGGTGHRAIPFIFSKQEAYVLLIGAGNPDDSWAVVNTRNSPGSAHAINRLVTYATFTPKITSFSYTQYYTQGDLNDIQYTQSGDVLILTHPLYPPIIIMRTATNTFKWIEYHVAFTINGSTISTTDGYRKLPYRDKNINASHTITLGSTLTVGGACTLTSSLPLFASGMIGSVFKVTRSGSTAVIAITGVTNSTTAAGYVLVDATTVGTTATSDWEEAAWSIYRGFPRTVCFYQQRLIFGGSGSSNPVYGNTRQPDTLWGSELGDIYEMDALGLAPDSGYGTVAATDPFVFTLAATEVNEIQWLAPGKTLSVGTLGREWNVLGPDPAQSFGPLNIDAQPETAHGSSFVQALRVANTVTFVQRAGTHIREFVYNYEEDAFRAELLTDNAEHMPRKGLELREEFTVGQVIQMAYQDADHGLVWALDSNGYLFACTRNRAKQIKAWHWHKIGGSLDGEDPFVRSICVAPSEDGTHDDLWLLVERTIDGDRVCYLERIGREFLGPELYLETEADLWDKPVYMDSAILVKEATSPSVVTATTFAGLDHLEGQTVQVLADGNYIGTKVVTGGEITLSTAANEVIVGLSYRSIVYPVPLEAGGMLGTAQGLLRGISRLVMRFYLTCSSKFGKSPDDPYLEDIDFRPSSVGAGDPIPLFTGLKEKSFPKDMDRDASFCLVTDDPLPWQVVSVTAEGTTSD